MILLLSDHIVNLNENVFIKTNIRHIYPNQVHHLTATTRAVRFDRPVDTPQHIRDAPPLAISMSNRLTLFGIG